MSNGLHRHPQRPIVAGDVEAYQRDGVVCLRAAFDPPWVERMRAAVERDLCSPGPHATNFAAGSTAGRFFGDMFMSRRDPDFRAVARHDLMGALEQYGYDLNEREKELVLDFRATLAEAGVDLFLAEKLGHEYVAQLRETLNIPNLR